VKPPRGVAGIVALFLFAAVPAFAGEFVLPAGAQTDCGPRGARVAIDAGVTFLGDSSPLDMTDGRRRWGPCFGGSSAAGCSTLGGICNSGEAEEQQFRNWWALCGPARPYTSQELHDATLGITGGQALISILQGQVMAGCPAAPVEGGGGVFSRGCPAGKVCRLPCPACPICPAPARPPDAWAYVAAGAVPEGEPLVFATQVGGVPVMQHHGVRKGAVWVTRGGSLPTCPAPGACAYAWRREAPLPEVQ
jgi:hypothetical protein